MAPGYAKKKPRTAVPVPAYPSLLSTAALAHGKETAVPAKRRKSDAAAEPAKLREGYGWDNAQDKRTLDPRNVHGQGRSVCDFVGVFEWGQLMAKHAVECGGSVGYHVDRMNRLGLAGHMHASCSKGADCNCTANEADEG